MKIRTSHTEPGSRLRQQRGASERRTDVPSRYVEVALATATALIRFAPACCAGAALRDRRVCSERLLLPSTWVGYGRGVQWPQVRRRPAQLARSVRSAGSAAVVFVTPRCRAALPRRIRSPRRLSPPPVLSFCVWQPGGGDRRRGQDRRRGRWVGGRATSDQRARVVMPLCLAASARRAVCPLFVFVCVPAEETSTAGRSAGERGGPRKARYAPA